MMQRTPVESSVLESVGYDPATKILEVKFKGDGLYDYFNFSARSYRKFITAESMGRFFVRNIKGKYPELRVPQTA